MSFVIQVTGGVGAPVQSSTEKLVTTLEKGEAAAEDLGAAMAKAGRASSTGMAAAAKEAERAQGATARLSSSTKAATSSGQAALGVFDGVARAIQREAAMLERIHGPLQRYTDDLQVLDSLLDRNKISTAQYADQVSRLNRELEKGRGLPAPGGAGKPTAPGIGSIAGIGNALTVAGGNLLSGAVAGGAQGLVDAVNTFQALQNKMRVVTGEGENTAEMFGKIRASAVATRSGIESTVGAYQRLRGATKEMGLGSDELLRITERINKAIKVSGASAEESSAGMQQLAQGIASGRLQGDELRSVLENLPYVADILAQSLGVTRGKLRELGEQGKLTSAVVVEAFTKMGAKIDADFGKTAPTLAEQWSTFKDQLMVTVGTIGTTLKIFETLGRALGNVASIVGVVGEAFDGLGYLIGKATGGAGGGAGSKIVEYIANPFAIVKDAAGLAKDGVQALGDTMTAHERGVQRVAKAYLDQVSALERLLREEAKLEQAAKTLDAARAAGLDVPGFDLEAAKAAIRTAQLAKQAWGIDLPPAFTEATKKAIDLDARLAKLKEQDAAKKLADEAERLARALKKGDDILAQQEDRRKGAIEDLAAYQGALAKLQDVRRLTPGAPLTRTEVEVARGVRDLELQVAAGEGRFGKIAVDEEMRRRERTRAIEDARGALEAGILTYDRYIARLREAGVEEDRATKLLREMRQPALDWAGSIGALNTLLRTGRIDLQQYNDELQKLAVANPTRSGVLPRGVNFVGGRKIGGVEVAVGFEALSPEQIKRANERDGGQPSGQARMFSGAVERSVLADLGIDTEINTAATEQLIEKERELFGVLGELAQQTDLWGGAYSRVVAQQDELSQALAKVREEATDVAGALEAALGGAFRNLETAAGDMVVAMAGGWDSFASSAKAAMRSFVEFSIRELTRLMIRQAIAGIVGGGGGGVSSDLFTRDSALMTIPGFAHGGSMRVAGAPGIDTNLLLARVSAGEQVNITPAGQTPGGSAAPPQVTVVNVYDDSQIEQWMEKKGESYTMNTLRRNRPAVRGRNTGR